MKPSLIPTVYSNGLQPGLILPPGNMEKSGEIFGCQKMRNKKKKNATRSGHRTDAQDSPSQQKIRWFKIAIVPRSRNPVPQH